MSRALAGDSAVAGGRGASNRADPAIDGLDRIGPSTWIASFQPDWIALGGIQGGLVVAVLLEAAVQAQGRRPGAISAHLHAPVAAGRAEVRAEVIRAGRTAASVSVLARQDKLCASALVLLEGSTDALPPTDSPLLGESMPITAPEETAPLSPPPGIRLPVLEQVEIRPTGDSRPLAGGQQAALRAWIRPRRPIANPLTRAAVLLDGLAPSLFAIWREAVPVPTIELTMHLAPSAPVSTWSAISQRTVWWNETYCVDEAELRNEDGSLIAQVRQRRRIMGRSQVGRP